MESLPVIASYIFVGAPCLFFGAALGYLTATQDARREMKPRYRRVGRPE